MNVQPLTMVIGPCLIESYEVVLEVGKAAKKLCQEFGFDFILKGSFKKANRTSLHSFSSIGDKNALEILKDVGNQLQCQMLTDIHSIEDAQLASLYVDYLQIPAFLARQTDLLIAAGKTGCKINIKKGQFMSPESMRFAKEKVESTGNKNVLLTERGTFFGYQDLVVDFRSIPIMRQLGCPVIMDCTHSLQQPNQSSGVTGGNPEMIETMARAAIAVGADGLFIETHPNPSVALSDGANMLDLSCLEQLLQNIHHLRQCYLTLA